MTPRAEPKFTLRTVNLHLYADDTVVLSVGPASQGMTPAEAREVSAALEYFAGVQERAAEENTTEAGP